MFVIIEEDESMTKLTTWYCHVCTHVDEDVDLADVTKFAFRLHDVAGIFDPNKKEFPPVVLGKSYVVLVRKYPELGYLYTGEMHVSRAFLGDNEMLNLKSGVNFMRTANKEQLSDFISAAFL
jgi:hypothetical protein